MKSDRAADLGLSRELTERQRDQLFVEQERAENLRRTEPNYPQTAAEVRAWSEEQHLRLGYVRVSTEGYLVTAADEGPKEVRQSLARRELVLSGEGLGKLRNG